MTDITWEEPPPASHGVYEGLVAELRKNPGRWAKLPGSYSVGHAADIRRGKLADFRPPEEFEVRSRTLTGSGTSVWARWLGPLQPSD